MNRRSKPVEVSVANSQVLQVVPAGVTTPDVTSHFRLTVTGAAATLATIATAIPTFDGRRPTAVSLVAEASGGACRFTYDGKTAATTALGNLMPVEPAAPVYIAVKGGIQDASISIISAGTTYLQAKFDWEE